jgi:hypothetical protein
MLARQNIGARFVVPTLATCVDLVVHLGIDGEGCRRARDRGRARSGRGGRRRDGGCLHQTGRCQVFITPAPMTRALAQLSARKSGDLRGFDGLAAGYLGIAGKAAQMGGRGPAPKGAHSRATSRSFADAAVLCADMDVGQSICEHPAQRGQQHQRDQRRRRGGLPGVCGVHVMPWAHRQNRGLVERASLTPAGLFTARKHVVICWHPHRRSATIEIVDERAQYSPSGGTAPTRSAMPRCS